MNNVRLVCGSQAVDIASDFGILINKSIADIRNPDQRSSDWTKTFTLPGTKANNKLFAHLFDLNLSIRNTGATNFNPDFNPNLKAPATLYVDEVVQISGFMRLLNISVTDRNEIQYECSLHGQLADLFATIADKRMSDLDFSEYNHALNITNITESWDTRIQKNGANYVNFSGGEPIGEGYVYGWIDNGEYGNYTRIYTDDMTPYIYAKTVVDKIFTVSGYRYTSDSFFNSAQFKRLVIPCPTQFPTLPDSAVLARQFDAYRSSNATFADGATLVFNAENADPNNQYNTTTGQYTAGFSGIYDIVFQNKATVTGLTSANTYQANYTLLKNGTPIQFKLSGGYNTGVGTSITIDQYIVFPFVPLNSGDVITLRFDYIYNTAGTFPTGYTYQQNTDSKFYNQIYATGWGYGQTIQLASFFPDEIKQREFMKWLLTLFNLYVEPNADNPTELVVKPREDFYNSTVRDWTTKRDLSQPLTILPMGEMDASRYLFTYAEGDDMGNKGYKEDYDRIYGDRKVEIDNQFVKAEKKIDIGFAPTLMNKFDANDKYIPYIENGDVKSERFYTGKLRLMQYKPLNCISYDIYHGSNGSTAFTTVTKYPYMGHLDDPTASTTDINFGMPRRVSLPPGTPYTNANAYNVYWSKYISEISHPNSKLVRGYFHLTPSDMELLSFQDLYYFDENYFRLNKIEDYDPINPSVNICEFLLLNEGATFAASGGTIGSGGSTEQEYDPIGGGTNGKVIQSKGISLGYSNSVGDGIGVGDSILNEGRANAAFGTSGTTFTQGSERSVVIGKGVQNVGSDEVWLQGRQITENNINIASITEVNTDGYNVQLTDDILVITGTADITVNLPTAASAILKKFTFKKMTGAAYFLRIEANGSEEIDESPNYQFTTHYGYITIISDGTQWLII